MGPIHPYYASSPPLIRIELASTETKGRLWVSLRSPKGTARWPLPAPFVSLWQVFSRLNLLRRGLLTETPGIEDDPLDVGSGASGDTGPLRSQPEAAMAKSHEDEASRTVQEAREHMAQLSHNALFKDPDVFADAIFDLVEKNPDDPSLAEVRDWIAANGGREAYAGEALRAEIRDNGRLLMEQLSVEVMRSERGGSFNTPAGLADLALRSVAKSAVEAETGRKEAPVRGKGLFVRDRYDVKENDARREDVFARIMEGLRERMEVGREVRGK